MDALLDPLIRFAQEMLAMHGEFYPVAATVTSAGAVEMVGGATGEEHPPSQTVIDTLYRGLLSEPGPGTSAHWAFASMCDSRSETTPTPFRSR
jgi:hypothetical protein